MNCLFASLPVSLDDLCVCVYVLGYLLASLTCVCVCVCARLPVSLADLFVFARLPVSLAALCLCGRLPFSLADLCVCVC